MSQERHGLPLSQVKQRTILTNTLVSSVVLVVNCFDVQFSNKSGYLKKLPTTREKMYVLVAALDVMFSKIQERRSETMYAE